MDDAALRNEIDQLKAALALEERRLKRSETAREQAEMLLEVRGHALAKANQDLRLREAELLKRVEKDSLNLLFAQEVANIATFHVSNGLSLVASRNFSSILGHNSPMTHMDQVLACLHPDEEFSAIRFLTGVRASETGESRDIRFLDATETPRWIRWHIKASREGFHGALHDITRETELSLSLREQGEQLSDRVKELEALGQALEIARSEAVKADQTKSRFLAMMSHDIRTPMNAILAMLELLAVGDLSSEQARMVNLALTSGNQMLILLADIIEVARADGWTFELSEDRLNLPEFLKSVTDSWRELARRKGLTVAMALPPDLPAIVLADKIRLRQVLDNLISNAVKYTLRGSVTVDCTLSRDADREMLRVAITDTGAGIAHGEQEKLFNDLQRVSGPLQQDVEGTGLGLSICARIITAMNGKIGLESDSGRGSTFWFTVPLQRGSDRDPIAPDAGIPVALPPLRVRGRTPHILVAEDIETNRIVMQSVLDAFGCSCLIVQDGIEAIAAINAHRFDLVLMDVSMPRMDGVAATEKIRSLANGREDIPIIGVTAFASQEEQFSLLAAGMTAIVVKPIKPAQLHEAMAASLERPSNEKRRSRPDAVPIPDFAKVELVDRAALDAQLGSVPPAIRKKLSETVQRDLRKWHRAFVEACNTRDPEAAARAHHALKGVCEGFGIRRYTVQLELARQALSSIGTVGTENLDGILSATLAEIERHANTV